MAVTMVMEFPATVEQYNEIHDSLGVDDDPPDGLILHTGAAIDGGIRVIDVWESEDHFNRFNDDRLGPAVMAVMGPPPEDAPAAGPQVTDLIRVINP
jgi:hypothetical protein